jgi:2-C-methyl-D-erythritol 4-phosphate cytidylyltransferase
LVYGILLAAGSGSRFGQKKQYLELAGVPVWRRALDTLWEAGVDGVWLVVPADDLPGFQERVIWDGKLRVVAGGPSRSESVQKGLRAIVDSIPSLLNRDSILIHDAARPFVHPSDVRRVIDEAAQVGGAILAGPCTDTVKQVSDTQAILRTIPRADLTLAQTPQVFWWEWVQAHYLQATADELNRATDDASIMEQSGRPVKAVIGVHPNMKVTTQRDWEYAEWLANRRWGSK